MIDLNNESSLKNRHFNKNQPECQQNDDLYTMRIIQKTTQTFRFDDFTHLCCGKIPIYLMGWVLWDAGQYLSDSIAAFCGETVDKITPVVYNFFIH